MILQVGDIKEKVLAAPRSGIHHVVVPPGNEVDVKEDLKAEQLADMVIHYAHNNELAGVSLLGPESAASQS